MENVVVLYPLKTEYLRGRLAVFLSGAKNVKPFCLYLLNMIAKEVTDDKTRDIE